jgi:hypothetical protein
MILNEKIVNYKVVYILIVQVWFKLFSIQDYLKNKK